MKNISNELKEHLAQDETTLATCWKVTRRDGAIMGFTSHDVTLEIDSLPYLAQTGISPTAVQTNSSFAVDNLEVEGMLSSEAIAEADINAGLYDFAELEIFMVNYEDLSMGKLQLRRGWIGEITYGKNHFIAEIRGLTQKLSQRIGNVFTPQCRAVFSDAKCGVDEVDYKISAAVTSAESRQVFASASLSQNAGYFNFGKVKFISGNNDGLQMEVKDFANSRVELVLPLPYEIAALDEFEIIAGCDKNFDSCVSKFDNAPNFRGEPHVPGQDKILETAGTFTRE
jgi:uncharacterized phage protein (TIGR02218 family)